MQTVKLEAQERSALSHGKLNSLRKSGWVPAVIYGEGKGKSSSVQIGAKAFLKAVGDHRTSNVIVELKIGSKTENAVIKEMQRDVVSRDLIHIDFLRISMDKAITLKVPVHLVGEAPGVKLHGGILEHMTRELEITCLPKDIPTTINVDITALEVGSGVLVKDIAAIPNVKILTEGSHIVVHVVSHKVVEETPAATAAVAAPGAAEPEVIAKGKKPDEEGAAATPAAGAKPGDKAAAPKAGGAGK